LQSFVKLRINSKPDPAYDIYRSKTFVAGARPKINK